MFSILIAIGQVLVFLLRFQYTRVVQCPHAKVSDIPVAQVKRQRPTSFTHSVLRLALFLPICTHAFPLYNLFIALHATHAKNEMATTNYITATNLRASKWIEYMLVMAGQCRSPEE